MGSTVLNSSNQAVIQKFDASGTHLQATYSVNFDLGAADWIDLAADQHTLFYTSIGTTIKRYDVTAGTGGTGAQLSNFPVNDGVDPIGTLPETAYGLRVLPDASILVTETDQVQHYGATGTLIKTYTKANFDPPGNPLSFAPGLEALTLDPDGTSFWTGDVGDNYPLNGNPAAAYFYCNRLTWVICIRPGKRLEF